MQIKAEQTETGACLCEKPCSEASGDGWLQGKGSESRASWYTSARFDAAGGGVSETLLTVGPQDPLWAAQGAQCLLWMCQ